MILHTLLSNFLSRANLFWKIRKQKLERNFLGRRKMDFDSTFSETLDPGNLKTFWDWIKVPAGRLWSE